MAQTQNEKRMKKNAFWLHDFVEQIKSHNCIIVVARQNTSTISNLCQLRFEEPLFILFYNQTILLSRNQNPSLLFVRFDNCYIFQFRSTSMYIEFTSKLKYFKVMIDQPILVRNNYIYFFVADSTCVTIHDKQGGK